MLHLHVSTVAQTLDTAFHISCKFQQPPYFLLHGYNGSVSGGDCNQQLRPLDVTKFYTLVLLSLVTHLYKAKSSCSLVDKLCKGGF